MAWLDLKSKGLHNIPGVPEASTYDIADTLSKLKARKIGHLSVGAGCLPTKIDAL